MNLIAWLRREWANRRTREELTEQYRHETEDPRMPETWDWSLVDLNEHIGPEYGGDE